MAWTVDLARSSVEFEARHLRLYAVRGRFTEFEVDVAFEPETPQHARLEVRVAADSLTTGNAQRDAMLRSEAFLDVERYPEIRFSGREVTRVGASTIWIRGELTLRGVRRTLVLDTNFEDASDSASGQRAALFRLTASLDLSDYLDAGPLARAFVSNAITITVHARLEEQPE